MSLQAVLIVRPCPAAAGLMRQIRARMEGRAGAGIAQPWRDLRKLFASSRSPRTARASSSASRRCCWWPLTLVVAVIAPFVTTASAAAPGRRPVRGGGPAGPRHRRLALAGLDTGTAFGGMGASRETTILALVEPTVLVAIFALSVRVGSTNLAAIVSSTLQDPAG